MEVNSELKDLIVAVEKKFSFLIATCSIGWKKPNWTTLSEIKNNMPELIKLILKKPSNIKSNANKNALKIEARKIEPTNRFKALVFDLGRIIERS